MSRIMFSGTNSGCGKTTVTCAVLAALVSCGITPAAFKCGPDYIDPMFLRAVSGIAAYNLDPFFLGADALRSHLAEYGGAFSVIEGAMGYYDGIASTSEASAYTAAKGTQTPIILVIGAKGAGASLGAVIEGFLRHKRDSQIKGVIFNDADNNRRADLKQIAEKAGAAFYGSLPRNSAYAIGSRRLGLLCADEIKNLQGILSALEEQARQSLDIDGIIALAKTAPALAASAGAKPPRAFISRLAVSKDAAFCFLYEENLEILKSSGCEIVFFSPLNDDALPQNINGLYLCGGYPELHAKTLSENKSMLKSIRRAIKNNLPTIAECGGFLYLHDTLGGFPMCGVISGAAFETKRPQRFGYITLIAGRDNLLCKAGEEIRAHEFHYWDSENPGGGFTARKPGRDFSYPCAHATDTLYAGFPHLYFPANPKFAENFAERTTRFEY